MYAALHTPILDSGMVIARASEARHWEGHELVVLPARGMITVSAAQLRVDRLGLVAGQGLHLRAAGRLRVEPDPMTGADYVVVNLPGRIYARPDLDPYPSPFELAGVPWLLALARGQQVPADTVSDFLESGREQHYQALRRLPGNWSHRTNLYRRLIEARFRFQPPESLCVAEVGNRVHLSRTRLFQLFRIAFGIRPREHYTRVALLRALNLLAWSSVSITEIAACCGYQDRTAFTRMFVAELGVPPMSVRSRLGSAGSGALEEVCRIIGQLRSGR